MHTTLKKCRKFDENPWQHSAAVERCIVVLAMHGVTDIAALDRADDPEFFGWLLGARDSAGLPTSWARRLTKRANISAWSEVQKTENADAIAAGLNEEHVLQYIEEMIAEQGDGGFLRLGRDAIEGSRSQEKKARPSSAHGFTPSQLYRQLPGSKMLIKQNSGLRKMCEHHADRLAYIQLLGGVDLISLAGSEQAAIPKAQPEGAEMIAPWRFGSRAGSQEPTRQRKGREREGWQRKVRQRQCQ